MHIGKKGVFILIVLIFGVFGPGCDGGGGSDDTPWPIILPPPGSPLTVSGNITFDFVPTTQFSGLDYSSTAQRPVRGAVVEAIFWPTPIILDSTTTDDSGDYTLDVTSGLDMFIRVKAQMLETGAPSWNFMVVDNTNFKALYAMDSAVFNTGSSDITGKDLNADSGWGVSGYTSPRVAGPFAILDTVYKCFNRILTANPTQSFQELKINWSVNNIAVAGDKALGEITTSHFSPSDGQLYILGKEDNDTDEYDDHVVAHEWGHYFEHFFSRSDNLGGSHGSDNILDPRVAFGEGFGNAFSGMVTDDRYYIDTFFTGQSTTGIFLDLQVNSQASQYQGWFSEYSIQTILYNLYVDTFSGLPVPIEPVYSVLVGDQKNTPALTTIFSFIHYLKENYSDYESDINILLTAENISASTINEWDSTATETNDAGDSGTLPLYNLLVDGGSAVSLCSNQTFGNYNKLNNRKFFYFQVGTSGTYTLTAVPDDNGDPVIVLYSQGSIVGARDAGNNGATETLSLSLNPGTYVGEVYDWDHVNDSRISEECFDVSFD